jgi:hypothetical protein
VVRGGGSVAAAMMQWKNHIAPMLVIVLYSAWVFFILSTCNPSNPESYEGAMWGMLILGLPSTGSLALGGVGDINVFNILLYAVVGAIQWYLVFLSARVLFLKLKAKFSHNQ